MGDNRRNPLGRLWSWFGTFTGVISLSSFAEELFQQIVEWKGFIEVLVESYRSIVNPIFVALTDWLPFSFPLWAGDYIVIGLIVSGSYFRVALSLANPSISSHLSRGIRASNKSLKFIVFVLQGISTFLLTLVVWPIVFFASVYSVVFKRGESHELWKNTSSLFCAVILGVILLLSVNTQL